MLAVILLSDFFFKLLFFEPALPVGLLCDWLQQGLRRHNLEKLLSFSKTLPATALHPGRVAWHHFELAHKAASQKLDTLLSRG